MGSLLAEVRRSGLNDGRRVLALTRIHGSRRRLDANLAELTALNRQYDASTIDSFAWRICTRWRSLARELGHAVPSIAAYDGICALAAVLLSRTVVRDWVVNSFPLIIVDEAQDLSQAQSQIVQQLSTRACVLLAYDEFQCLDQALRPIAILKWLSLICVPVVLTQNHRTNRSELLAAGAALRDGRSLSLGGKALKILIAGPSAGAPPKLAATWLNYAAMRDGSLALLTPSRNGGFADNVITLAQAGFSIKNGTKIFRPLPIRWEQSDREGLSLIASKFRFPASGEGTEIVSALSSIVDPHIISDIDHWLLRRRRTTGKTTASEAEVIARLEASYSRRRKFGHRHQSKLNAMTIHQAKNREFDHVVVIWPFSIPESDDQRRRLLYNAVTRAKFSCVVLVQGNELMSGAPFVGA